MQWPSINTPYLNKSNFPTTYQSFKNTLNTLTVSNHWKTSLKAYALPELVHEIIMKWSQNRESLYMNQPSSQYCFFLRSSRTSFQLTFGLELFTCISYLRLYSPTSPLPSPNICYDCGFLSPRLLMASTPAEHFACNTNPSVSCFYFKQSY